MTIILYSIPIFFLLIALELVMDRVRGTHFYRLNDSVTSLSTGIISRLVSVIQLLIPFTLYVYVEQNWAFLDLGDSVWIWIIAFVVYDFLYYWNHRLGHEVNILWAAHVVHHSSEEYNLTTALRQTGTGFLSVIFYVPLALLGIDPVIMVSVASLNLVYQFWVHTRHIGKLGWFEWFFVSPSNHRVHHAQNAVYIDKNYGGVFIVWDRLFGTYQEELDSDPVIFGITDAVKSWNPVWVNFQVYWSLIRDAFYAGSWRDKLTLWFRRTGSRPSDSASRFPSKKVDITQFEKFNTTIPTALKIYVLMQFSLLSTIAVYFFIKGPEMLIMEQLYHSAYIVIGVFGIGSLMESKHFAGVIEWSRNVILIILILPYPTALFYGLLALAGLSCPFLFLGRLQPCQQHSETISVATNLIRDE